MNIKYCDAFSMDNPVEACNHILDNMEIIKRYGNYACGHDLYTWDDGKRNLIQCKCGGYILAQHSEFHGYENDSYYSDYFPVSGEMEAEWLNTRYDGFEIESKFETRYLMLNNMRPCWSGSEIINPQEQSGFIAVKDKLIAQEEARILAEEKKKREQAEYDESQRILYENQFREKLEHFGLDKCIIDKPLTESYSLDKNVEVLERGKPYIFWLSLTSDCNLNQLFDKVALLRSEEVPENFVDYIFDNFSENYDSSTIGRIFRPHVVAILSNSKPALTKEQMDKCLELGITYAKPLDNRSYYDFLSGKSYVRNDCYDCITEDAISVAAIKWIEQ